jgi:hypothetical protein
MAMVPMTVVSMFYLQEEDLIIKFLWVKNRELIFGVHLLLMMEVTLLYL